MKAEKPRFFIFAGEHSGDLHGSHLLKALKLRFADALVTGVGGPCIRSVGIQPVLNMEDFEVMGFSDVLKSLPKLWSQFGRVKSHILDSKPDAVILVDYPGFNLRLAKALKTSGYHGKIIQYISPTVWAWGKDRADMMARHYDLLLSIYPFEPAHFSHTPLKVKYVGNPLREYIQSHLYCNEWKRSCGIPAEAQLISVFPGSRPAEIMRNLPIQLEAAEKWLSENPDRALAISAVTDTIANGIASLIGKASSLKLDQNVFLVPKTCTYELMKDSRTALAKSGTVTLELALHKRPAVVTYQLTRLNRFVGKYILGLKLPHYCIVNILSGESTFPELIEHGLDSGPLLKHLGDLDRDTPHRQKCLDSCLALEQILKNESASRNAANAIAEILAC